jgi:hypothetical protein
MELHKNYDAVKFPVDTTGVVRITIRGGEFIHFPVTDFRVEGNGGLAWTNVSHSYVDRGVTEADRRDEGGVVAHRMSKCDPRFTSVKDDPSLSRHFVRLYYAREMAVSDCE